MTPQDLVKALRTVPEKKLRLVELAWELANEEGELNVEAAAERVDEVDAAAREVGAYIEATRRLLWRLNDLARW
ncbi:MAG: hypothetical protein Q8P22_09400 [Chloroflexota bacterium]|nr:hypothetical protein [Chloroflexota bacterium]